MKKVIFSAMRLRTLLYAAAISAVLVTPAFSQGCALCYTQAAQSGARMIQALRDGIIILVIPPTALTVGVLGLLYHKRNQYKQAGGVNSADRW